MSDEIPSADPCPEGFDAERVAALVCDGSDDAAWEHVYSCPACAEQYFDHVVVGDLAHGIAAAQSPPPAAKPRLAPVRRLSWLPIAALVLVAVGGLATAAALMRRRPVLVHTEGWKTGSLAELELHTGLETGDLGLPLDARVLALTSNVEDGGRLGTTAVVRSVGQWGYELLGFMPEGDLRWVGSRVWPDWDETLGMSAVGFHSMAGLVIRRDERRMHEAVCLVAERERTGGLFLLDPQSGRKLGHYLHPGPLAAHLRTSEAASLLPAETGVTRRLLVPGQHGHDGVRRPCLSVLELGPEPDGGLRLVQHVEFPVIGANGSEGGSTNLCLVDWTPGHHRVVIETNEWILFAAEIVDGRLALDTVEAGYSDQTRTRYDAQHGEGAFAAWERERLQGAAEGVTIPQMLAAEVEETEFEEVSSWLVR